MTRAGGAAQRNPAMLWKHLAAKLLPPDRPGFDAVATLVLLLYAATSADAESPIDRIGAVLNELGWRHGDGRPLAGYEIYRLPAFAVLANVTAESGTHRRRTPVSAAAAALARAALR